MWELATQEAEEEAVQSRILQQEPMVSTQQESFKAPPPSVYTKPIGSRVMNTRDLRPIPKDTRDLTFLVETGIRAPHTRMDYTDIGNLVQPEGPHTGDLYTSQAITFYSAEPGRGGQQGFAGRTGKASFPKCTTYSTPVEFSYQKEKE